MTADNHPPHHRIDASREVRARIEHVLHIRRAPPGTTSAKLEQLVKAAGARGWAQLKKRPSLGVALAGVAGFAVASAVGVGEIAIGMIADYSAYQVLREGVAPRDAAKQVVEEIAKLG